MRSEAPSLPPLFCSRHQAEPLTWLYLHPHDEYPATDLAARLGVPLSTLHRQGAAPGRLGLPVNPTMRSPRQRQDASDALVQQVKASPR
ncbi:hypothetical protein [Dactylosporangium sp. NPDC006015]|uniref:hypothetical protein n=1 Tax=Dactylosporangium sp. NPDC006015 TaxID=3154576 RepID=UPI0033AE71A1